MRCQQNCFALDCLYSPFQNWLNSCLSYFIRLVIFYVICTSKIHDPLFLSFRSGSIKDGSLVACAFAPDASFFVTGSSCGDLTVWDETMKCLYNEKAHDLGVTCCDFSSKLASG